jgi:hypothetical protein
MSTTRRFSFGIKSLSVILSVLTVLVSLPLTVFASNIRNLVNKNNEPDRSVGESGVFSSYTLVELEDERDQYTKVIRDSNGKITVAEYGMPVHIQNSEGKWEDVDNTLSDKGDHYLTGNTDISIAKEICNGSDVFSLDNGRITVTGRIQEEVNSLIKSFLSGNTNPGLGTKHLINDIYYLRGRNGARVFFRMVDNTMEILGKAYKGNEQKVIDLVKKVFG